MFYCVSFFFFLHTIPFMELVFDKCLLALVPFATIKNSVDFSLTEGQRRCQLVTKHTHTGNTRGTYSII